MSFDDQAVVHVGRGTPAGTLLREHWQPVAVAAELTAGDTRAVRVLGEDLTLYRTEAGEAHVVAGRCSHRGTLLHTGRVEGDCLRCMYHGWRFDPDGRCVERPAERPGPAPKADIPAYALEEYAGLVWIHFAADPPPLPRYPELEQPGTRVVGGIRPPGPWPMNYFQALENNVDPVHVSFVHHDTEPYGQEIPEVSVEPTGDGLAMTAVRSGVPRVTWYRFPYLIQITLRMIPGDDTEFWFFNWAVPVDDEHTMFIASTVIPDELADRVRKDLAGRTMAAADADELLSGRRRPASVTEEDFVVMVGQGTVADRSNEHLGRSDVGVIALRQLWTEQLTVRP